MQRSFIIHSILTTYQNYFPKFIILSHIEIFQINNNFCFYRPYFYYHLLKFKITLQNNLQIQMSIYSGLPTRQDQTNYNKLVCRLISTMQEHIIQLCNGSISSHFSNKYSKIIARMLTYEQHKYLPPKFSTLLKPLQQIIKDSIMQRPTNDRTQFNLKLQAVKQQQQLPSSRQMAKHKTQLNIKRSIMKSKKPYQKSALLSQSDVKQKNGRSYSVFSQKKSKIDIQFRKVEKLNPRQSLADFVYKRQNEIHSSGSGYKYRTKSRHITEPDRPSTKGERNLMKALSQAMQNNNG